jgi:hypothetical protein
MLPRSVSTLADAVGLFRRKANAGQIPNRKTGALRSLSETEQQVVISHVTTAIRAASGSAEPMSVRVAPHLEVLVDFAKRDAEEHGRSPDREASSVRLFLMVVEGREPKTQRRVVRDAILPAWLPLYDALTGLRDGNANRRSPRSARYPGYLYGLQSFLQLRDIQSPHDIPTYETICTWAGKEGVKRKDLDNWFTAYRTARAACDASLPELAPSPIGRHRGLKGLPNLQALVDGAARRDANAAKILGDRTAHDVTDQLDLVKILAPHIGDALQAYLDHTTKSGAWQQSVVTAASCLVAELVRLGNADELHDLDLIDLTTRRVPIQLGESRESGLGLLRRHVDSSGPADISLLRAWADAAARRSFASSPIELRDARIPQDEVPWYTDAIFNDASAIWSVTDFVYGQGSGAAHGGMATAAPERWARVRAEHDLLRQHMKAVNGRRQSDRHKDKSLLDFTWATVVCAGLSRLWREVMDLRQRYHALSAKHPEDAPVRARARRQYHDRLKDYVLAALLLDDGLRIKNYAMGRVGLHFLPDVVRGTHGGWQRIAGLRTSFRGYDRDAGLKISRSAKGAERTRTRGLLPGIMDMELLSDYWFEARPHDLAACGLIESIDAFDPDQDNFTLFVSPVSTHPCGAYGPPSLSGRFGKFLHGFMRDVLGREVPDWGELRGRNADQSAKSVWRGIFGAHPARQLIATYVGGIRNDWGHASALTNDAIQTLQIHYTEVKPFFEDAMTRSGIEHPHHFDEVVDRLWRGEVIDWATFDPNDPAASLRPEGGGGSP